MKARRSRKRDPSRPGSASGALKRLRRAERRLRELEERHEIAMGAINESVYDWDISGDRVHFSGDMERVLGLPPDALRKGFKGWYERIHPDDYARYREATVAHLKGATERFECDYRYRARDGSWHWARTHGLAIRNRQGRAIRMIGSIGDITELKTSEERYALATAAAVEGIYEWNLQTGELFLSDRAKAFFALPTGELTPAVWNRRIHGDDYPGYRAAIIDHFKGGAPHIEHEYRIADGRGGFKWVLDRGIGVRNADGRVTKLVGALSDITPRKRAELELRRARDQAEEALAQQTAIAEILSVISSSPTDAQPVFETIVRKVRSLFGTRFVGMFVPRGEQLEIVAFTGDPGFERIVESYPRPLDEQTIVGKAMLRRQVLQLAPIVGNPETPPGTEDYGRKFGYESIIAVPLVNKGRVIGGIGAARHEPVPFDDRQVALMKSFADQAVIAIENVRLFNETTEALERQTATAEILSVISSSPTDTQPVFDAIVQSGLKLFSGAAISVALPDGDMIRAAAVAESDPGRAQVWRNRFPFPLARDYMHGVSILDCRVVDVPDVENAPVEWAAGSRNFLASGYRAITIMPMMRGGAAIGALSVVRLAPGPLSEKQLAVLKTFADQAVIAIENVRLLNETKEALERQTATSEVLRVISSSPNDLQSVFDAILENATRICEAQFGTLLLYDGAQFHVQALHKVPPAFAEALRREPRSAGPTTGLGRLVAAKRPVHIHDLAAEGAYAAREPMRVQTVELGGVRTALVVPLLKGDDLVGGLQICRQEVEPFTEKQIGLVCTFADQAVIAIENARLFNETKESLEQQKASGEVLGAISSSIADTAPVFDKILESCERLFAGRIVGLNLVGEDGALHIGAYHGAHREEFERIFPLPATSESGSGLCIVERRVVHYPDAEHGEGVPARTRQGCKAIGINSVIFAPMLWEGRGMGAIFVGRDHVSSFSEKEIALLKTFADQAVIAVQNARLFREIHEKSRQLEIANRHKSEFLANMSHELRTPLNAIIGFTRIVMRRSQEQLEPKQYENLEKILSSGQNLLALINAILDLSKVEAGRVEVNAAEIALGPVLEQCLRTVEPLVRAESVTLLREFDGAPPQMYVDEEKLRQIVINLLSNAAKFTALGSIKLQSAAANGSVAIAVIDTGIGIPADKLDVIFEEFEQADASSTRVHGGTGLGLTIARRLARLMGGDIRAQSTPGSGSTFTLTLPVRYAA